MAFTKLEKDMNIIQKLDDEPNDVGGMTSAELKAKFDEGNNAMKKWINNTFIPEAEETLRLAKLESVPDHASQHSASGSDPITPDMIGAVPYIGFVTQTLFDNLSYETSYSGWVSSVTTGTPRAGYWNVLYLASGNGNHGTQIVFGMNYQEVWFRQALNNEGEVSEWSQLATTDYAVNKAGDTITGTLKLLDQYFRDRNTEFFCYENMTILRHYIDGDNHYHALLIAPDHGGLVYQQHITGDEPNYNIHHTGNKPSGSYTGNGDAAERVIDTGGIGNYLMLSNGVTTSIVGPDGALSFNASTGTITTHGPSEARFLSGVLTMRSAHADLNYLSYGYYYHVL